VFNFVLNATFAYFMKRLWWVSPELVKTSESQLALLPKTQ